MVVLARVFSTLFDDMVRHGKRREQGRRSRSARVQWSRATREAATQDERQASVLNGAGFATLLFDLLTPAEELDRRNVFDIEVLAEPLRAVTNWLRAQPETAALPVAYFGASTGAAALRAAAEEGASIAAVVSRGGRADLAGPLLPLWLLPHC